MLRTTAFIIALILTSGLTPVTAYAQVGIEDNYGLEIELNDQKMRTFAEAAAKIRDTNRHWDILISGAENDTLAVENSTYAREEILKIFNTIADQITIEEYNTIFAAANRDTKLNDLVQAYIKVYRSGRMIDIPLYQEKTTPNSPDQPINPTASANQKTQKK